MSVFETRLTEHKQQSSTHTSNSRRSGSKGLKYISKSDLAAKSDMRTTNGNDITGEHNDADSQYGSHKWTIISD
jgi:hypothetical protein